MNIYIYLLFIRTLNQANREKTIPMTPGQINTIYTKDNEPECKFIFFYKKNK